MKKLRVVVFFLCVAFSVLGQTNAFNATITNYVKVSGGFMLGWMSKGTDSVVKWSPDLATPFSDLAVLSYPQNSYTDTVHWADSTCFYCVELNPPAGMGLIPAGEYQMGDSFGEDLADELPVHNVYVSDFYMGKHEVTNEEIVQVMQWAYDNGKLIVTSAGALNAQGDQQELMELDYLYCRIIWDGSTFSVKSGKGAGHPCLDINWYGAVAYCNYRSEMEGRTPCYNLNNWSCDWNVDGYRLPTEAEWEKAARGGLNGKRFGWGDLITHSNANYNSSTNYVYDVSSTRGYHPVYNDGIRPYTSPVGSFAPNGYGLYDMVGNAFEWCWDWYDDGYYGYSPLLNPKGPSFGSQRVIRGGSWNTVIVVGRLANRSKFYLSSYAPGFRVCLPAE